MTEMKAPLAVVVVAVLLAGMAAAVPVLAAPAPAQTDDVAVDVAPGERLMAAVGTTGGELDADVSERAYGVAVAEAAGDHDALADVVGARLANASDRLAAVESRLAELETALEEGSISAGRFQAEVARLEAERRSIERMANLSAAATAGIPEAHLADRGINASAIDQLRERANDLDGRNVSRIARSIAGAGAGEPPGHRPDLRERVGAGVDRAVDRVNESGDAEAAIDGAARLVDRAAQQVDRAAHLLEVRGGEAGSLDAARDRLDAARTALASARNATSDGDAQTARERAADAATAAGEAIVLAQEAIDAVRGPPGSPPGDPPGGPPDDG
ncbi:MAG: hypothetical protein ACLFM8_06050 [Halobacteriales archaeon]